MTRKINPKSLENLKKRKPFTKDDPRINRLGRASNFDQLRKLFQEIANEEVDGNKATRIRKIGEQMSTDKKMIKDFLEFAYGKVPVKLEGELSGEIKFHHVYDDEPRIQNSSSEELPQKPDGSNTKSGKA